MSAIKTHLFVALSAAAVIAGCKKPLTYVHVQIVPAANEPAGITKVDLQLTLGARSDTLSITDPAGGALALPTDVTLQIGSGSGQLAITAVASNAQGAEVDRATATVDVASGAIAQATVQLPGGRPVIVPVEAQHNFPNVTDGSQGSPVVVSFHNSGFQRSGAVSLALGGVGKDQFTLSNDTCTGAAVAPGASCTVTVTFAPTLSGAIAATLTLSANPGGDTAITLTGNGDPNPQGMSVRIAGTGQGSITSSPAGLSCSGGTCSGTFDYATTLTLTPAPATGSHLTGWAGACSGAGACTVSMTQARSATATFDLDQETLTAAVSGNGSVSSLDGHISCDATSPATCAASYAYDTSVTLIAEANTGSDFTGWSDPACGATATCVLTLTGPRTVTANFVLHSYTVAAQVSALHFGGGTLTSTDGVFNCTANGAPCGQHDYAYGSTITFTAAPPSDSNFTGWSVDAGACTLPSGPTGPCLYTVGGAATVTAVFDHKPVAVAVTITGDGGGQIGDGANSCSTSCTLLEPFQTPFTLTATADSTSSPGAATGSLLAHCDLANSPPNGCLVDSLSADSDVSVPFLRTILTVTPSGAPGTVTSADHAIDNCGGSGGNCQATLTTGSSVSLTGSGTSSGQVLKSWSGPQGCGSSNPCVFTINGPQGITANFEYTLALSVVSTGLGTGTGTVQCAVNGGSAGTCLTSYPPGTVVTLTASHASDSVFVGWSGSCTGNGACGPLTMNSGQIVTATFQQNVLSVSISGATGGSVSTAETPTHKINGCGTGGNCSAAYNVGAAVSLNASNGSGSTFTGWGGGAASCGSNPANCGLTMNGPTAVSASFDWNLGTTVTTSPAGPAGGTLQCALVIGGIQQTPGACLAHYPAGTQLNVIANKNGGFNFTGWSGACTTNASPCSLTMTAAQSVTATFKAIETVTVNNTSGNSPGGTVTSPESPNPLISCTAGGASCSGGYNFGDTIVLTASMGVNTQVTWTGCTSTSGTLNGSTCTISGIGANTTIGAAFSLRTFTLTVNKTGSSGAGAIATTSDGKISCGATCSATYNYGDAPSLKATSNSGSLFTAWTAGCTSSTDACTVPAITSNLTVTGVFASGSLCTSNYGQVFSPLMQGCAGTVPFTNASGPARGSLCGVNAHVCNANEWVQNNGSIAPAHDYWTDDNLGFSNNQTTVGDCGTSSCTSAHCFVSLNNDFSYANGCGSNPMRVCVPGFGADPEGNTCTWTSCGFNSIAPNQNFGGCSSNGGGALCCANSLHRYTVSTTGVDPANCASVTGPFRTITAALSCATSGDTVSVGTGVYGPSSSPPEAFPLVVRPGVNLIGDEANRGNQAGAQVLLSGCSPVTFTVNGHSYFGAVEPLANSTVAGFTITCPSGHGIVPNGSNVTIRNNTLTANGQAGIAFDGAAAGNVLLNTITNNGNWGVVFSHLASGTYGAKLENNFVSGNADGVDIADSTIDLGGGGSIGNNTLSCNTGDDLSENLVSGTVLAQNNLWDHVPPTTGTGLGGVDIRNNSGATFDTSSARFSTCGTWNCSPGVSCGDVYDLSLQAGTAVALNVTNVTGNSIVRLGAFAPGTPLNGQNLLTGQPTDRLCNGAFNASDSTSFIAGTTGTYKLTVMRDFNGSSGLTGTYRLTMLGSQALTGVTLSASNSSSLETATQCGYTFTTTQSWSCGSGVNCQDVYDFQPATGPGSFFSAVTVSVGGLDANSAARMAVFNSGGSLNSTNALNGLSSPSYTQCAAKGIADSRTTSTIFSPFRVAIGRDAAKSTAGTNGGTYTVTISTNNTPLFPATPTQSVNDGVPLFTASSCP